MLKLEEIRKGMSVRVLQELFRSRQVSCTLCRFFVSRCWRALLRLGLQPVTLSWLMGSKLMKRVAVPVLIMMAPTASAYAQSFFEVVSSGPVETVRTALYWALNDSRFRKVLRT